MSQWDYIQKRGALRYGTQTSLLSYFEDGSSRAGYEYQILKSFCDSNGLKLEVIPYDNNGQLFNDLKSGIIDLAGGHLTVTKKRLEHFKFTQPINNTSVSLVTHYDYRDIEDLSELAGATGYLIKGSSYVELLNQFAADQRDHIVISEVHSLFDIIREINSKNIDFTLGDSEIIAIYQNFIPGLYTPIQVSNNQKVALMARRVQSDRLLQKLNQFITEGQRLGLFEDYKQNLLHYIPDIDTANTVTFFNKLKSNWPIVKHWVYEVADEMGFDAMLLAAMSYQESHWELDATSITGVKGLMMLTRFTAKEMGVKDRIDPVQSLRGGIKYFRKMKNKLPQRIRDTDRTKLALAAYNMGYGHLEDARILTQRQGKNPDLWNDVKNFLPQLNKPAVAKTLKHGAADGKTARTYVENIMIYRKLMAWQQQKEKNN
ncbi:membrane-bound lytic murein transglycosylase F [Marinicella pacifica]|uniref:Membrane-bound lytic murein transglycosylase F n=2 Tax=Marinicella pacifica TaxID=1171543 RepID=A0A917FR88_9GAMM|nr:membrane-bound lytic murein transglycosylase F [Marinicella pacifica]